MVVAVVGWGGLLPSLQIKSLKTDWEEVYLAKTKRRWRRKEELVQTGKLPLNKKIIN